MDKRYPGPETIGRVELANGITILTYENFSGQSVVINGLLRAGALQEPAERAGLADFCAELLMRGTKNLAFDQIYEQLEAVGAGLGIGSSRHVTHFSGSGLAEDLDLMLDLLAQSLREPIFPREQVERVRGQIQTDLQMRANDTNRMAGLKFMETLYNGHPYGRSVHGYQDTIASITREDLVDFHARHYGPQGIIIAVVGAVPAANAIDKISTVLGDWRNDDQVPVPEVPDVPRPQQLVTTRVAMPDKYQSDIVIGLPGPRRSAEDYLAASLTNTILGVFGMMGRIGRVIREERGLAYHASSSLSGGLGPAPWTAGAGVAPENVDEAVEGIIAEFARIREELVSPEELDDAVSYRVGSLPVSLEGNPNLAGVFVDMELFGLGLDYLQSFPDLMRSITAEQVQAAAQKYLSSHQLVVTVAGP